MPVLPFATAIFVATLSQAGNPDRVRAIELARQGDARAAIEMFQQIVARDPADVDARLWVARLDMRLGRIDKAEAGFRAVHEAHPEDIDAQIGLGAALTRKGAVAEALDVLKAAERAAGENVDLYGALALALRRSGDDRRAMSYYTRALALAPDYGDIRGGYETLARTYGHGIVFEGFGQEMTSGSKAWSGSLTGTVRVTPHLHLEGQMRAQTGPGYSDTLAGAGVLWHAGRATTVSLRGWGGRGNLALATADFSAEVVHYAGIFEIGAAARKLEFSDDGVTALSPLFAFDPGGRWRLDSRYTYSRSSFDRRAGRTSDQSGLLRLTWRYSPRVWTSGTYAYGIESFKDLTADRIAALGAHTAAAGVRFNLRSLTVLNATWEHQWRSNARRLDRLTLSIAQFFP